MDFKQINLEIQEIEQEWKNGDEDITGATHRVKEVLENYHNSDDAVVHFKDYKVPEGFGRNHIPSNITELDALIGGFGKGDIILISGDTGDGKSTFARFLIHKLSEQKKKSLVFSYEETNEEFISKFCGELPDGYIPKVLTAKDPVWIEAKVLEAVELYGIEAVFIDNLKGIINYDNRRNEVSEVDSIMQKLKAIAIKYNIVLFLLAHIKKSDTGLIDKNSLTGSKTIVDTSSVGIALYRGRETQRNDEKVITGIKYNNYTAVYLIKNRYKGKYDNFSMLFDPETGTYKPEKMPTKYKPSGNIISAEDIKRDMQ
jgi:replicative DNA helicase